jgi:plasmid stability protein
MALNLSIKNVPEHVVERLRSRAERNRRSLQGELLTIVEAAVALQSSPAPPVAPATALHERAPAYRTGSTRGRNVAPRAKLRWVTVDGGLPSGIDLTDRGAMHDWLARTR